MEIPPGGRRGSTKIDVDEEAVSVDLVSFCVFVPVCVVDPVSVADDPECVIEDPDSVLDDPDSVCAVEVAVIVVSPVVLDWASHAGNCKYTIQAKKTKSKSRRTCSLFGFWPFPRRRQRCQYEQRTDQTQ
jgi:hypothetical protein